MTFGAKKEQEAPPPPPPPPPPLENQAAPTEAPKNSAKRHPHQLIKTARGNYMMVGAGLLHDVAGAIASEDKRVRDCNTTARVPVAEMQYDKWYEPAAIQPAA